MRGPGAAGAGGGGAAAGRAGRRSAPSPAPAGRWRGRGRGRGRPPGSCGGESPAAASRSRPGAGSGAGPRAEPEPAAARSAAFGKGNARGVSPWGGRGGEGALPPAECPPAFKHCSEPHRGLKAFSNGVFSPLPPATNMCSAESTEGTYRLCCYKILLLQFLLFPECSFLNPLIGEISNHDLG